MKHSKKKVKNKLAKRKRIRKIVRVMKTKTITQMEVLKAVRKTLPPASRAFTDKRGKDKRKEWKREVW